MNEPLHVAVAVLVDDAGRTLVMQRLPGSHMAGRWEFPGGKVEPGESVEQAIHRELDEELGIAPHTLRPLIRIRHDYPGRRVLLDCWRIEAWSGEVLAREGHPLEWRTPDALSDVDLLDADRPVVAALRLPPRYAITGAGDPGGVRAGVRRLLTAGHGLLQLRAHGLDAARYRALAVDVLTDCRAYGARLLLNSMPGVAAGCGADGVHLTTGRLMALEERPLPRHRLVGASCHDAAEIAHAAAIGCDFAVLGPVQATPSHTDATPMGWPRFGEIVDCAGLPVYALGGVGDGDLGTAWAHHGQGVAAITAWW